MFMGVRVLIRFKREIYKILPGRAVCRRLFISVLVGFAVYPAAAQNVNFGVNFSGGKEPVKIDADAVEMRDKDGIAVLTGNVSVVQGDRALRAGKMVVHYTKTGDKNAVNGEDQAKKSHFAGGAGGDKQAVHSANSFGAAGIETLDITNKVYVRSGKQVAVGDAGQFNAKNNIMVLTGAKVVLTDGENVASGCRLTAHMDTGKAYLESCSTAGAKGRVSVIVNRNGPN